MFDAGRAATIASSAPEWFEFAAGHAAATVFHHPGWIEVLARSYGYESGVFTLVSGEGGIVAGLPFISVRSRVTGSRRVALPFTDHSPALCAPGWERRLASALADWASKGDPLEVHARMPAGDENLISAGVRHLMRLDDIDGLRVRFAKTPIGRALRKGERSELALTVEHDLEAVRAYYRLHCLTHRRLGVPIQPWRFFRMLHQFLIAEGLGMIVLARFHGRPVAGGVFLTWNSTLVYKFGASDPAYWDLRPNNLVMWHAIKWGFANGCRTLDFGKTDTGNAGLRRFKSSWGADEVPHHHTVFPYSSGPDRSSVALRAASRLIQRCPVIVARAAGQLLYGHYA